MSKHMGRPATGHVIKPSERQPSFGLRFTAHGTRHYLNLGRPEDGWTLAMAERELAVALRDVDLGTWRAPQRNPAPTTDVDPTFHEFASDWFAAKRLEIEQNTADSYVNDLTNHLLPFFKEHHLAQITVAEVDRYRQSKVREAAENGKPMTVSYTDRAGRRYRRRARPLSARSINMHIDLLAQILAVAVDHGQIPTNPAVGRRRRLKVSSRGPCTWTAPARSRCCSRRPAISTVEQASSRSEAAAVNPPGPSGRRSRRQAAAPPSPRCCSAADARRRPARCCGATWTSPTGGSWSRATTRDETDAGTREVDMLPLLREILA